MNFLVVPAFTDRIILGNLFLGQQQAIVNFSDFILSLDGWGIPLGTPTAGELSELDNRILNKSSVFLLFNNKVQELVRPFATGPNVIGRYKWNDIILC